MQVRFDEIALNVRPDISHEWVLPTSEVAEGYGVTPEAVRSHKSRNGDDFIEGRHFISVANCNAGRNQADTYWTKRGVIQLGFFIKSDRARRFRFWAEDLILSELTSPTQNDGSLSPRVILLETEVADLKQEVADLKAALAKPLRLRPAYAQKALPAARVDLNPVVSTYFGPPAHDQDTRFMSIHEVMAYLRQRDGLPNVGYKTVAQAIAQLIGTGSVSLYLPEIKHSKRGYWLQLLKQQVS